METATLKYRSWKYFSTQEPSFPDRDPNSEELPVTWPPYDVQTREYLDFDFKLSVNKDFHVDATRIFQPQLRELFQNEKQEL
uniref:Uncharacterized protein n=1 Tax=Magallana gigas TaxID=29159 RepID=K1Q5K5_MAGGI